MVIFNKDLILIYIPVDDYNTNNFGSCGLSTKKKKNTRVNLHDKPVIAAD